MARAWWWAAGAAVGLALGGCASFNEAWNSWLGDAPSAPPALAATGNDVFYAGSEELPLHELPSGASSIVARLALHQRVTRINISRGYAEVRTDSGLEGWVDTAELLWRLPSTPEIAAPAAGETAPPPATETAAPAIPTAAPIPETPVALTPEPATPVPATAVEAAPAIPVTAQPTPSGWTWRNLFPGGAGEAPPAPTAADTAVPIEPVPATPVDAAPTDTPLTTEPPPIEAAPTEGVAPPSTPTAAPEPTKEKRGLRSLFP